MKKIIITAALLVWIGSTGAKAQQVVSAQGVHYTITPQRYSYLLQYNNAAINQALKSMASIKNNDTADIIIALLQHEEALSKRALLLAAQKRKQTNSI